MTRRYLSYLAHHPDTARRIAQELAIRFVSDTPSQALVDHLARVYLDNDTAIKPVLRALIATAEFQGSAGQKVRTSTEDIIATYRALGVKVAKPTAHGGRERDVVPDHRPRPGPVRVGPARRATRPQRGVVLGVPAAGVVPYPLRHERRLVPDPGRPVPQAGLVVARQDDPFDQLVDHLSRTLLGQNSSAALLKACCQATGVSPARRSPPPTPLRGTRCRGCSPRSSTPPPS